MAKKVIKIISIILIVMTIISVFQIPCYAAGMSDVSKDVNFWKPKDEVDDTDFKTKVNTITGVIKNVGTVVSLLTLIAIGIKFMTGSVEQKAEYKQTLIPWIIGAALILAMTRIPDIIYEFTKGAF